MSLRRSFAAIARDAGINAKIINDQIDHANANVMRQIYLHRSTGAATPSQH